MPKFAPVVPVKLAFQMRTKGLLGDYHLLLAHDVVKHADAYMNVYNDGTPECDANFIIMDNSVIELGTAVSVEMLQEACEIVNANVLALPDVLLEGDRTFAHSIDAFERWSDKIDFTKIKPMIIPQGGNFREWVSNLTQFAGHPVSKVCCVGIPRNVKEKLSVPRAAAAMAVQGTLPTAGTHLLGFSNSLADDLFTLRTHPSIWGIDSAVPIRQQTLMNLQQSDPGPRGTWWEYMELRGVDNLTHDDWRRIEFNLDFIRRYIAEPNE